MLSAIVFSLLFMARFERARLLVTISTSPNHLFRLASFIHFHVVEKLRKIWEQSCGEPNRENSFGRRHIFRRTENDISIILIGHRPLCWCDFSPLFSSSIRWRPAGECKHHSRVPVCLCACGSCVVSSLFDRIYVYHDSHKMSLCNV